ncbi:hypothetical protein [Legionella cardiaca]|uniref:hypothetical protein n=1 Tax=Legionella cardiaca TaxID=1071983 RepID=UPI003B847E80
MCLDDENERHYYLQEASSQNWSTCLLERNIKSRHYRRLLFTQGHEEAAIHNHQQSPWLIKDPYVLEFLMS